MHNSAADPKALEEENLALRQKVDALERAVSELSAGQESPSELEPSPWWVKALFVIILCLAAIPVYLVVQDRWFEQPVSIKLVDEWWWNNPVLKTLAYPRYFLIVFLAVGLNAVGVFFWRRRPLLVFSNLSLGVLEGTLTKPSDRQHRIGRYLLFTALMIANISAILTFAGGRIPGWDLLLALALFISAWLLMEYSLNGLKEYFHQHGRILFDGTLFILSVCLGLYALFGETQPNLLFYLILLAATLNFLRHRRDIPLLFWVSVAALVALTWKLNGWEYVVIGDEYSFYNEIRNILDNRTAWQLLNETFNGNFVYGTHPYFSSYIHNFFLKLFDNHNFGWRFSNPCLVAAALFFYHYFFKAFVPQRSALITVSLLGFSHYLLSFSKIGYNNLQAFFALGLVLAAMTWTLRSMRLAAFAFLGLAVGLCFYIYPAALYVTPLPVLGLLIYFPPKNRDAWTRWGWMIVAAALLLYPLIAQPKYWEAKIPGTFLYTDVSSSAGELGRNISVNVLYSGLSFLFMPEQSHYVSTGYMDPLSSLFVMIGFVCLAKLTFGRNKSAIWMLTSFLFMFLMVGATHGRNFPTATRMFLLLPWFALFAALGLEWFAANAARLFGANQRNLIVLGTSLLVLVNLYHAYVIDIRNMAQYHTLAPLFIKVAREIHAHPNTPPKSYAFVAPPGWDISGMTVIQRAYLVPDSPRQLINLPVEDTQLPESAADLVTQRDIVVIVKGDMDGTLMAQVGAQLQGWGKSMCEIRNHKGTLQFQLWHSGDLSWLCP